MTAKALTSDYYGQDISRSYFTGCSRGGGQALMEAQRYLEDFEGIFRTLAQALRRCVILRLRLKSLADWNETLKPGIAGAEERSNADLGSVAVATPLGAAPPGGRYGGGRSSRGYSRGGGFRGEGVRRRR